MVDFKKYSSMKYLHDSKAEIYVVTKMYLNHEIITCNKSPFFEVIGVFALKSDAIKAVESMQCNRNSENILYSISSTKVREWRGNA